MWLIPRTMVPGQFLSHTHTSKKQPSALFRGFASGQAKEERRKAPSSKHGEPTFSPQRPGITNYNQSSLSNDQSVVINC